MQAQAQAQIQASEDVHEHSGTEDQGGEEAAAVSTPADASQEEPPAVVVPPGFTRVMVYNSFLYELKLKGGDLGEGWYICCPAPPTLIREGEFDLPTSELDAIRSAAAEASVPVTTESAEEGKNS